MKFFRPAVAKKLKKRINMFACENLTRIPLHAGVVSAAPLLYNPLSVVDHFLCDFDYASQSAEGKWSITNPLTKDSGGCILGNVGVHANGSTCHCLCWGRNVREVRRRDPGLCKRSQMPLSPAWPHKSSCPHHYLINKKKVIHVSLWSNKRNSQ